jgi:hypothetical protein
VPGWRLEDDDPGEHAGQDEPERHEDHGQHVVADVPADGDGAVGLAPDHDLVGAGPLRDERGDGLTLVTGRAVADRVLTVGDGHDVARGIRDGQRGCWPVPAVGRGARVLVVHEVVTGLVDHHRSRRADIDAGEALHAVRRPDETGHEHAGTGPDPTGDQHPPHHTPQPPSPSRRPGHRSRHRCGPLELHSPTLRRPRRSSLVTSRTVLEPLPAGGRPGGLFRAGCRAVRWLRWGRGG